MAQQLALTTTSQPRRGALAPSQRSLPAFLNKLYAMVDDANTDELIRWSEAGDSFLVPQPDKFGATLLPRFFKHSNFGSFVRQLNMYSFRKVPHLQQGVLKHDPADEADGDMLEFSNPNFLRHQPDLLHLIRRQNKAANAASGGAVASTSSALSPGGTSTAAVPANLPGLMTDLAAVRKHQAALSAELRDLQTNNHALWSEALASRERAQAQQETIDKILRFLATVFGGSVVAPGGAAAAGLSGEGGAQKAEEIIDEIGSGKGKGPMFQRPRLLLEDVQREQAGAAKSSASGSTGPRTRTRTAESESEGQTPASGVNIEEIEDEDDALPTISSASITPWLATETTSPSQKGKGVVPPPAKLTPFETAPASQPLGGYPNPTAFSSGTASYPSSAGTVSLPLPASGSSGANLTLPLLSNGDSPGTDFQIPQDFLASLMQPSSTDPSLNALLSGAPSSFGGLSAPTASAGYTPYAGMQAQGQNGATPYSFSSTAPNALSLLAPDMSQALQENESRLSRGLEAKSSIESRMKSLEDSIGRIVTNLPGMDDQTRERITTPTPKEREERAKEWGWDQQELDKFLSQYVNMPGASPVADSSAAYDFSTQSPFDPTGHFLNDDDNGGDTDDSFDAGTPEPHHFELTLPQLKEEDDGESTTSTTGRGKKRKSEVVEAPTPSEGAATRSSGRKRNKA